MNPSRRWTTEYGSFWGWEEEFGLPPEYEPRVGVEFDEVEEREVNDLAAALNLPSPDPFLERLTGRRRCFSLRVNGELASYGWVTLGPEEVGELERRFNLFDNEAYIWDCVTLPAWRGNGLYSALLSRMLYQLHREGIPRIWIGASRLNEPSIRGIENAGFTRAVDLTYRRFLRLTTMWFHSPRSSQRPLVSEAYRVLVSEHERLIGRLAIGYLR